MGIVYDFSLQQVNENIGCIAPKTIVSLGDMVLFLSALGVYAYDGENLVYLSKPIERDLKDVNHLYMEYACAGYDRGKNQYWLAVPSKGKNYNDTVFVYDFFLKAWMPPYTDMNCDIISGFEEGGQEKILCGSSDGYLYRLNHGKNNGMEVGYNIVPSSLVGSDVVAFYDSQSIYTEGDGLLGLPVRALDVSGGDGLTRIITAATATQITVSPPWGSSVNSNTTMCLLGIDSYIRTKDYALGSPDQLKLFRQFSPRLLQSGKFDVKVNAIIDINDLSQAMSADVSVYDPSIICFTGGDYATGTSSRFSGTIETVSVGASSVIVSAGSDISASLLAGYCMYYWNSGTRRVWPINSGECEALNLGLYGTQSLVAVNSDTTYLINTNLEGTFGTARWGMGKTSKKDIAVRGTSLQDCVGEYISFKIGNNRANETWRMYGFDILSKPIGRR
ncbi:MAG: hypothetical protein EHM49_01010 [Deltaproteobacteria bacterium]|nr:MAG: hypothetical protein EHM49_01010 [Deltaproteobacteria bacterium]